MFTYRLLVDSNNELEPIKLEVEADRHDFMGHFDDRADGTPFGMRFYLGEYVCGEVLRVVFWYATEKSPLEVHTIGTQGG